MSSDLQDDTQFDPRPRRAFDSATLEASVPNSPPMASNPLPAVFDDLAFPAVDPFAHEMDFRVDLNMFRGPLDLLLYLVRKHELDIMDIPISLVTDQYTAYLEFLEQLDVDAVGDFVDVASLLVEIKSRMALPQVEEAADGAALQEDPRDELVQRLLEYKQFKDAASMLGETSHEWQQRYPRVANDLPPRTVDPADQPIHEVELWDLVSAMGRIMRDTEKLKPVTSIVYDDTPVEVFMQILHERIIREGRVSFTSMFEPGMVKPRMIGVFLAVLELVRNYGVIVDQNGLHADMWVKQGEHFKPSLDLTEAFSDFDAEELAAPKPR